MTGGLAGVMEAACKGAYDLGGIALGIIPFDEFSKTNNYCNVSVFWHGLRKELHNGILG